jgi:glycosyltransferase involved in cell wall biosynthesis
MPHLLSINSYHYRRGGADAVYLDHAALMQALGWRNTFFSMKHPQNLPCDTSDFFVDEIQIGHEYSLGQKIVKAAQVVYSLEAQRKLRALIDGCRPDIAHLHNIYHHLSPSILPVLTSRGIPVVMTAHDLKLVCPNNKMLNRHGICERCKPGYYHHTILNRCVHDSVVASAIIAAESTLHRLLGSYRRHVARIIVPSRFYLGKLIDWGWPAEQLIHVPNYIDAGAFEPDFSPGSYIVYSGRLSVEKGLDTLIRAAARAKVRLVVVGTGPIRTELEATARTAGADVVFAGYRSGHELAELVRAARASVLPSEWYENAPLSVLESMALGKPVIGARMGGVTEMIVPEANGWLFDSGNVDSLETCLRRVVDLPDATVAEMGRRARADVENRFGRQRYIDAILKIYSSLGIASARIVPGPDAEPFTAC